MTEKLPTVADLFTIGHSNHELRRFFSLLQEHCVTALVDVRSRPYSARHPQFNRESVRRAVGSYGMKYVFLGKELGGRSEHDQVYVAGRVSYRLIAATTSFVEGLQRVKRGVEKHTLALMCAEKDPLTCHRMILVCRYLKSEDIRIRHILGDGSLESMDTAEERLLKTTGLPTDDLFKTREDLIDEAYERQAHRIAYVRSDHTEAKVDG